MTNLRLTGMVYLIDWKHSLKEKNQATGIRWINGEVGPYSDDVKTVIKNNPDVFRIVREDKRFSGKETLVSLVVQTSDAGLSDYLRPTVDEVIDKTRGLSCAEFHDFVNATFPVINCSSYQHIDLVKQSDYMRFLRQKADREKA